MPRRVCGSTVGATIRTLPAIALPPAGVTVARVPGWTWARSAACTSARHSSRPWRIIRKSSCPAGSTAPTVALRAEMTPSSGATTAVCVTLSWRACTAARCASRRARAVRSAVTYWLIVASLSAPVARRLWARSALAAASASVASASASDARVCSRSTCIVSGENVARISPRLTTSPTLTRTSARRRPLASVPMLASCQAAMLPLACTVSGSVARCGRVTTTLSAGLAATGFFSPLSSTA
jgi:hypothetical protein